MRNRCGGYQFKTPIGKVEVKKMRRWILWFQQREKERCNRGGKQRFKLQGCGFEKLRHSGKVFTLHTINSCFWPFWDKKCESSKREILTLSWTYRGQCKKFRLIRNCYNRNNPRIATKKVEFLVNLFQFCFHWVIRTVHLDVRPVTKLL